MENLILTLKPLPLILAIIIKMLLGGLWYSPVLFGKKWMKLTNFNEADMKTDASKRIMKIGYTSSIVMAFITSYIIGVLIQSLKIEHLGGGLGIMLLFFIGFSFPVLLSRHLWENRPWGLLPIDGSYEWFSSTLVGLLYLYF